MHSNSFYNCLSSNEELSYVEKTPEKAEREHPGSEFSNGGLTYRFLEYNAIIFGSIQAITMPAL